MSMKFGVSEEGDEMVVVGGNEDWNFIVAEFQRT